jgi:hypothetical protein
VYVMVVAETTSEVLVLVLQVHLIFLSVIIVRIVWTDRQH